MSHEKILSSTRYFFLFAYSNAQIVDIPDTNFKNALLNHTPVIDANGDGEIQVTEAEATIYLSVSNQQISSLEGVQYFINLETLRCLKNPLGSLDVTQCPNLVDLDCSYNLLPSIDVTLNQNLEILRCENNLIVSLDNSLNQDLRTLFCSNNLMTSLNLSQSPEISGVICDNTPLTNIDVTSNPNIIWLNINNNQISDIDLSMNHMLQDLEIKHTSLQELDLRHNLNLRSLICRSNDQLLGLNIRNGENNRLYKLLAFDNPNLPCIQVDDVFYANTQTCSNNNYGWCIDPTAEYSEDCNFFGVEDYENLLAITIYPNPVKDIIFVKAPDVVIETYSIYNIQGQSILKGFFLKEINVSILPAGMYFIQLSVQGKTTTHKFIKQ